MITTTINTVEVLPTPPSPNSPETFDSLAFAYTEAQNRFGVDFNTQSTNLNQFATQANALATEVNTAKTETIAAKNVAVAASGATKWVSGTSYAEGAVVWSPIDFKSYRAKQATSGTTDPSTDIANWASLLRTLPDYLLSSRYFTLHNDVSGSVAATHDRIYFHPIIFKADTEITSVCFRTGTGTMFPDFVFGIYDSDPDTHMPRNKLIQSAPITSLVASTVYDNALSYTFLADIVYYTAFLGSTAASNLSASAVKPKLSDIFGLTTAYECTSTINCFIVDAYTYTSTLPTTAPTAVPSSAIALPFFFKKA